MTYSKLFEPGQIAGISLKNRMVMVSLATGTAEKDQSIGPEFLTYLSERADGGVGLIILENTRVDDTHGIAAQRQASVARDDLIPSLKHAVDVLHAKGVKVMTQLHHPGRETFMNINGNQPLWSSSSKPCGVCQQETHEMTTQEVEEIIQKFIAGAVRSQKAGFDGVELHGAHGYLISQFLSPYTNLRTDRFGGSFEGRFEFIKEIIEGIQKACGSDFPVGVRLTVDELLEPNGIKDYLTLAEGLKVAQALEKLGIAFLDVSNGIYESFNSLSEPITYPQGCRTERIRVIRNGVKLPLIAVNMIKEPWFAEKMLEDNLVDFVGLGRAVLADPEWPKKAFDGREADINRCISCNFCFETLVSDTIPGKGPIKCAVNARACREYFYPDYPQDGKGRTVVVVGAGVAGLEAARVLALRGFTPIVLEKENQIGGQINIANKPPHKEKINWIVDYEKHQLDKMGVKILTNTVATPALIDSYHPYAVILATGAEPVRPTTLPGIHLPMVYTLDQVLSGAVVLKNKKVALIGSGSSGLETAEFLCENGNELTFVEMQETIGKGVYVQHYLDAMDKLKPYTIHTLPFHQLKEIRENEIVLENLATRQTETCPTDAVVLAIGVKPVQTLLKDCESICPNTFIIGDAAHPGRIESAIRTAFETAYALK